MSDPTEKAMTLEACLKWLQPDEDFQFTRLESGGYKITLSTRSSTAKPKPFSTTLTVINSDVRPIAFHVEYLIRKCRYENTLYQRE